MTLTIKKDKLNKIIYIKPKKNYNLKKLDKYINQKKYNGIILDYSLIDINENDIKSNNKLFYILNKDTKKRNAIYNKNLTESLKTGYKYLLNGGGNKIKYDERNIKVDYNNLRIDFKNKDECRRFSNYYFNNIKLS